MGIISPETWDNMPKEEKEEILRHYRAVNKINNIEYITIFEALFGKENLQPKIKTWEDCQKMNEDSNFFMRIDDNLELQDKVYSKCIATLKIAKLIELGYGGMVTEEEWLKEENPKFVIKCTTDIKPRLYKDDVYDDIQFVAFHTDKQRNEFMSYDENVELIRQYYMI